MNTKQMTRDLAIAALAFVRDDPEAAGQAVGEMRDAIVAAGMMEPPLIDIDGGNLFLTDRGRRVLAGTEL